MATTANARGLLTDPNDPNAVSPATLGSANPNAGTNGIYSPLQGVTPQLAGGAAGVSQQNYGGALAGATKQYAFNPRYAALDQALQRQAANAGFDRTNALSSLDQNYQHQTADAERINGVAIKNLQAKMATQGIYNSGINVDANTDLTNDYQRYVGDLGNQYAGGKASVENAYGRTLGDISSQREGLYQQQAEEERQAQIAAAQAKAEADARQQQAQMQAQLNAQLIASQQAALAQAQSYQRSMPSAGSIGVGAGGGGGGGGGAGAFGATDWGQVINLVNQAYDPTQLQQFWAMASTGGAPQEVLSAINSRFVSVQDQMKSGANQINRAAPHTGNSRAY